MKKENKIKYLIFALILIIIDQTSKFWIASNIPLYEIKYDFFNGILRIIHVQNPGVLFSIGNNLPTLIRIIAFIILPIIILFFVLRFILFDKSLTNLQRWALSGILAGGIGNIIDRIFRPNGVIDFIDIKFYGLFGLDRWPTFNFADSCGVVFGIVLFVTLIFDNKKRRENGI